MGVFRPDPIVRQRRPSAFPAAAVQIIAAASACVITLSAPTAAAVTGTQTLQPATNLITVSAPLAAAVTSPITLTATANVITVDAPVAAAFQATVVTPAACLITVSAPVATEVTAPVTLTALTNLITLLAPTATIVQSTVVPATVSTITFSAPAPVLHVGTVTLPASSASILFAAPLASTPGLNQYEQWVTEVSTGRIILCELQPAEALTGWVVVGGNPQTYRLAWSSRITFGHDASPVYRRLDFVRQNDITLTARASIAQVQANLGSWFFDESGGNLYISTTTGVTPSVFAAIAAYFTLFIATEPADFVDGQLYEPRLFGALPTIQASADDPFVPVKPVVQGLIDCVNAHAFFDIPADRYIWRNKIVRLFLGGGALPRASYVPIALCQIDYLAVNDDVARFGIRSLATVLEQQLPLNIFTVIEYPRLANGLEGTYKPLLYGRKSNIPGLCIDSFYKGWPADQKPDPAAYRDVYLIADPAVQVITGVQAVRAINRTTGEVRGLAPSDYSVNLSACTVTVTAVGADFTATFRADQWDLRIDATGQTDGVGGYLKTFGQIVKALLLALGESATDIDTATFLDADAKAPFPLGLWLRDPQQASAVMSLLQQSVIGNLHIGTSGQWRVHVLDVVDAVTNAPVLEDADIVTWRAVERVDPIYPLVRCFFDRDPSTQQDRLTTTQSDAARYLFESPDGLTVNTLLTESADAELMAQRYRLIAVAPDHQFDVDLRGLELMTANVYDRALVTRDRAPGGSYVNRAMEILGYTKAFAPPSVRVRLGDLSGISDLIGHVRNWAPAGGADTYAASTPTEQGDLMYWGDDNDEVDPGVTNPSIWW